MSSYAQAGEDLALVKILAGRRGGVFVEAGGFDGVTYSNTCLLERAYGWSGVLIEPIPALAEQCKRARPESIVAEVALGAEEGVADLTIPVSAPEFSTLRGEQHMNLRVKPEGDVDTLRVRVRRLDQLLLELGVESFDLLSLDVEDAEWEALRGINLRSFGVSVAILERDHLDPRILGLMTRAGLAFHSRVGRNDIWVRESARRRRFVGLIRVMSSGCGPTIRFIVRRGFRAIGLLEVVRRLRKRW